jgi:uracil-DNA glycosylase family 4
MGSMDLSRYLGKKRVHTDGLKDAPVLIITEFPDDDAEDAGVPIAGKAAERLYGALEGAGIERAKIRTMALCNYKVADNKFFYAEDSPQLREGVAEIELAMKQSPPKIILLLGEYSLQYMMHLFGISDWRGSCLTLNGIKVIPTYNPISPALKDPTNLPGFYSDIARIAEFLDKSFPIIDFNFTINPRGFDAQDCIKEILSHEIYSVDIESKKESTHIKCCGFGLSSRRAICFANDSLFGLGSEFRVTLDLLLDNDKGKVFHNSIFDVEMLYLNGVTVRNVIWDTMVAQHVLNLELKRGLDFLVSTYTYIPCYWAGTSRDNEKAWSDKTPAQTLYTYNCKDCAATYEIYKEQEKELEGRTKEIFQYEMSMLEVSHHISRAGFTIDEARREELRARVTDALVYHYSTLKAVIGKDINLASPKQVQEFLYTELKLPLQTKRTGQVTTDEDALVKLVGHCKSELLKYTSELKQNEWTKKLAVCKIILIIRGLFKLLSSYINLEASPDGKVRSTWKVAATETGRWSASLYVDGTGVNSQTFPRDSY